MMNRRSFLATAAGGALAAALGTESARAVTGDNAATMARVALVKDGDRATAVRTALELLDVNPVRGRRVLLKPNFNTADPFPASTHNDTLAALVAHLRRLDAAAITIGERSGPPDTGGVMDDKGIPALARRLDVDVVNFEALPEHDWVRVKPAGCHWRDGFDVARPVLEAESVVSTCCLKTHGYGGVFTLSLKLSVGVTHKRNMREMHSSPHMRRMIAEINQAYTPHLILLDGTEAFTDGGPSRGTRKHPGVILAGTDRVAVDAVGLAVLKAVGSNRAIMDTPIFAQEQIARAVELGLGVPLPERIELVTADPASRTYAARLADNLHTQGV